MTFFKKEKYHPSTGLREGWEAVPRTADSPTRCIVISYLQGTSAAGHAQKQFILFNRLKAVLSLM